jgi:hypothetical protein
MTNAHASKIYRACKMRRLNDGSAFKMPVTGTIQHAAYIQCQETWWVIDNMRCIVAIRRRLWRNVGAILVDCHVRRTYARTLRDGDWTEIESCNKCSAWPASCADSLLSATLAAAATGLSITRAVFMPVIRAYFSSNREPWGRRTLGLWSVRSSVWRRELRYVCVCVCVCVFRDAASTRKIVGEFTILFALHHPIVCMWFEKLI